MSSNSTTNGTPEMKNDGSGNNPEPIAIVGMGCRWPGDVQDASGLWELLKNKQTGYREFGDHRFPLSGFHHPNPDRPGSIATRGGFLLAEDPRLFDPAFFGMTPLEVETMDPSQRKLLEVVYEAFENAGEPWESFSGSRTGVFVGNFSTDHTLIAGRDPDHPRPYASTGSSISILSNRINYILNLLGPSVTLDTACSSSMYALHLAVTAIRSGDCDSAIVAASNCIMDPSAQLMMTKLGVLSPTSTCHTFDASADGYARGEGFAALYLKKVSDAVKGDFPIRAVVRGTAINANGRTGGITHPSNLGQEAVIRQAYQNAGNLPLGDTTYFECHGTGTPVGDPIEVSTISDVFSSEKSADDPLYLGSIKTNLGHTESASAIAGIMKVVLALEHGVIPPSVGVKNLNPKIDLEKAKAVVLREMTPWPAGKIRRASINSFGYGGANGHCIIDHVNNVIPNYVKPGVYAAPQKPLADVVEIDGPIDSEIVPPHYPLAKEVKSVRKADAVTRDLVVLPFSAHNEASLKLNIAALADNIGAHNLADDAYTLSTKRTKLMQRTFSIVNREDPEQSLKESLGKLAVISSSAKTAKLGFIFTGQGAQWPAMGRELRQYAVFRKSIEYMDYVLSALPGKPSWKIEDILTGDCEPDRIHHPEVSQTVCTAVQVALLDLLSSWNVRPSGVAGHSSGEMAATYAAGRITAAEAIAAAYFRGQAVSKNKQQGAMLAVGLGQEEAQEYLIGLEEKIKIAAVNSPNSVTLSGDIDAVQDLAKILDQDRKFNRLLQTGGNAYHSHHMRALGEDYESLLSKGLARVADLGLADLKQRYPATAWTSSVYPEKASLGIDVNPRYWRANLESPVRFSDAVLRMATSESNPIDVLVEVGPHPALKGPVSQILKSVDETKPYFSTLKRKEDAQVSILNLAGTLFCLNAQIDLGLVNSVDEIDAEDGLTLVHGSTAVDLPPYKYAYGPIHYYESRFSQELRARNIQSHDLVGSKLPGNAKLRPQWRNILRLKDLPWLGDHRLLPHPVFPGAGYIAMAVEVASRAYNELPEPFPITGFSLRNVSISNALRIPDDDYGVEVLISLELVDTATAKAPAWTSFSISSVVKDSDQWTKHCSGLVKVEIGAPTLSKKLSTEMDARAVSTRAWYKTFKEIGLGYGPAFQGLREIQADPARKLAVAKVALDTTAGTIKGGESSYPLHPASLDAIFQLGLIACHGGQTNVAHTAYVPTHIDRLYIKNGNTETWGTAIAGGELKGLRGAYANMQLVNQSGEVVMDLPQLRCISYTEKQSSQDLNKEFSAPVMRLSWKPDVRSLKTSQAGKLFPPPQENVDKCYLFDVFDRLATLMVVDIFERYGHKGELAHAAENQREFMKWVRKRVDDDNDYVKEAKQLSSDERQQLITKLVEENQHCSDVRIAREIFNNIDDILYERRSGLDVVVPNGMLTSLYEEGITMTGAYPQVLKLFDALGHIEPSLNILEVGAGTGGATRIIMKALANDNGIKRYKEYTYTDVSSGFLSAAREAMAKYRDMNFSVLNIENDPLTQGFEPVYDVVIASECLHATASISETLTNCRRLLKPGGKLIVIENTRTIIGHGLVLGNLTGYWSGIPDGRVESPFLTLEQWNSALVAAGFSGTDLSLDDYPAPYTTASTIIATAVETNEAKATPQATESNVYLLYSNEKPEILGQLAVELERRQIKFEILPINQSTYLPLNSRVIVSLEDDFLMIDANEHHLQMIKNIVRSASSTVSLTSTGIVKGTNPDAGVAAGLLRTIGTENPTSKFLFVDIDPASDVKDPNLAKSIIDRELALQSKSTGESEDHEFVWQDGCLWVSRVVPDTALGEFYEKLEMHPSRAEMLPFGRHGPVRAAFETPGILTSLYFKPYEEMWKPLPQDWIQVKVAAVGLNWKDLAISAGRFDMNNFSSEFSGVVDKVGADVVDFRPGDKVYGMGKGHFGNYVRTPARLAQRMQEGDDFVDVATMPLVYMTAIYAFEHATKLKKNEKVLIQSATGGLGLCAIQLARSKGAEIFATAGTADKARYLTEKAGIPASHIFSSRDPKDIPRLIEASGGKGFDVILGTSTGDMLHESLKLVAPLGRYVDVGRVDVQNSMTMALELFQKSATFSSFDLGVVMDASAEMGRLLMESVDKHYRAGHIGPVKPVTSSDVSQLDQVLLGFSKGTHIGKLVVTFQDPDALVKMVPPVPRAQFDSEARYIITGGLGGLGRSIVRWMVERGACDFVILSRSGTQSSEAQALVADLDARGIKVSSVRCDVSKADDVRRVFLKYSQDKTIKGVVHAAVSYQDLSFDKLSTEQWTSGLAAKVHGTRNLHEATKSLPLDFFVMTTSLESVLALATQSAYTAANNFQEMFARYRRSQGLPASTASFGLITDVGFLSTSTTTLNLMARNKALGVTEHEFLKYLEIAFLNNKIGEEAESWSGVQEDPLSGSTIITCLDPREMAEKKLEEMAANNGNIGPTPRWYSDARVAQVMRAFEDAQRHHDDDGAQSKNKGHGNSATAELRQSFEEAIAKGPEERNKTHALVTSAVVATVAQVLFIDVSGVDANRTVADYGVDSLIAAELRNWFNTAFGADISMLDLLDTRTSMKDLAGMIVDGALAA
ncbi:polyketide synthase [Daldinia caldariorum]|uniref:polyketide synthase n=1 Tax=Daldinia caldariorum TaxID=326644 RepID=UPI00200725E7|nr:polyketide synthase [Daldinia caldariorum]KAI1462952.1 polyketide synthase [Daldinia caldariorum]